MQAVSRAKNIKIYIVSHTDIECCETDCLKLLRSDTLAGNNIACKEDYCELRAQYYVWKNCEFQADYVGFFHYRRYLDFSKQRKFMIRPYSIRIAPKSTQYTKEKISDAMKDADVVLPIAEYTGINVIKRYEQSRGHYGNDLQLLINIIKEYFPEYCRAMDQYLSGEYEYFGNIFVMRLDIFKKYCEWLFEVLKLFDSRKVACHMHADGYLGERLLGIYYTWLKEQGNICCCEVPRVHFAMYDDANHHFSRDKIVNFFLPPGSKLRAGVRRLKYRRGRT